MTEKKEGKIIVYCNPQMLTLCTPLRSSKVLTAYGQENHKWLVAEYDYAELDKVTEEACEKADAFWRSCDGGAWIEQEKYQPRIMRKTGLHTYICDVYGASQPRNVSACISQIAIREGKDVIDFVNNLPNG